jgi:hypothetical protein
LAAFDKLDWRRIDVWAIAGCAGLASIFEQARPFYREWLERNGYAIDSLDCRPGLRKAIPELGRVLKWEEQFGYSLGADSRNLDALRDGFEFEIPAGGGRVFEILGADIAWHEDSRWMLGMLSIAQEQSRWQLALGRRFFTLLVLPEGSPLIGVEIEKTAVPFPFSSASRAPDEFAG